jgi:catechol 2,3-dioxygenase-like lactoylglutathione lyase family enzyme
VTEPTQPPERMLAGHFIVSDDVQRSRRFYTEVLGGTVVFGPEPTNVALANNFIVINAGGGPTDDKRSSTPTRSVATSEIPTVTSSRSGRPPTHRETGGPPTGH